MNSKTALITGAAKRIGRAIALTLADQGYNIALHYNQSADDALQLAETIKAKNVQCNTYQCDLNDTQSVSSLISEVCRDFTLIDLLINNASIFQKDSIRKLNLTRLQENIQVHYIAPYILTNAFANQTKEGHIINILDRHVTKGKTEFASYLISKKALSGLTEVAAAELAPGIRVNAIAPGFILKPQDADQNYIEERINQIPLQKIGDVDDIANAVAFLEETAYITGQTLFVDGGEHLN